MHRVELKVLVFEGLYYPVFDLFLMHRVELKAVG